MWNGLEALAARSCPLFAVNRFSCRMNGKKDRQWLDGVTWRCEAVVQHLFSVYVNRLLCCMKCKPLQANR